MRHEATNATVCCQTSVGSCFSVFLYLSILRFCQKGWQAHPLAFSLQAICLQWPFVCCAAPILGLICALGQVALLGDPTAMLSNSHRLTASWLGSWSSAAKFGSKAYRPTLALWR